MGRLERGQGPGGEGRGARGRLAVKEADGRVEGGEALGSIPRFRFLPPRAGRRSVSRSSALSCGCLVFLAGAPTCQPGTCRGAGWSAGLGWAWAWEVSSPDLVADHIP